MSSTNIKKKGRVDPEASRGIKMSAEPPSKAIFRLNSKLVVENDIDTGYVNPEDITQLLEKAKVVEKGRTKGMSLRQDAEQSTNHAFRITKTDYNKMWDK